MQAGGRGRLLAHRRLLLAPRSEQRVHEQVGVRVGAGLLQPLRRGLHASQRLGSAVLQAREADAHRPLRRARRDRDGAVRLLGVRPGSGLGLGLELGLGLGLRVWFRARVRGRV